MRDVKDPMRTAMAIRRLPKASRIRVKHIGGIIESKYRERVEREQKQNNRYEWLGELSPKMTHREIAKSHLLVVSSRSEGSANVISEAIVAGTPVVSTRIPGSIGLLGENYQGYFTTANTKELRELLLRSEVEAAFYRKLRDACEAQRPLFAPERERAALKELIQSLMG
jgi:glycosyltransferase involved in cell wall biosynthesis